MGPVLQIPDCITWHTNTVDLTDLPESELDKVQACPYTKGHADLDFLWNEVTTSTHMDSIPDRFFGGDAMDITCYSPFVEKTLISNDGPSYTVLQVWNLLIFSYMI